MKNSPLTLLGRSCWWGARWARSVAGSFLLRLPNKPEVQVNWAESAQPLLLSALPGIHSQMARYKDRFAFLVFHEPTLRPGRDLARESTV
jgi:hypothetical protein